jgi:hypothetical protein
VFFPTVYTPRLNPRGVGPIYHDKLDKFASL